MNKFFKILLFALVATMAFAEILEEDNVQVVTDDNIAEILAQEFVLLEFYAPWCGHCKKLAPEYSKAAEILKQSDKLVPLAKCDATVHKAAAAPYGVKGFPTLIFFNNGNAIEYNGGRQTADIVNWIMKRTGDISQLVTDNESLEQIKQNNKIVLVYFAQALEGSQWDSFKATAMAFDNMAFAHTTDAAIAQSNNSELGKLVLFKQFDEGRNDFTGELTTERIAEFINSNKLATVMEFDDSIIEAVFQKSTPTLFLFHNDSQQSLEARAKFEEIAKALKGGEVIFAYLIPESQHWQRLADYIGVNTAVVPAVYLFQNVNKNNEKYQFDRELTLENVQAFFSEWKAQTLSAFVKSEEVPATNDEPVKVIVGKNFDELVMNNNKDVLLEFYAPWCGHCKKLTPEYESAAEQLLGNPNIVLAKCDATANEIPGVNISGYPTIKYYPNGQKNAPVDFTGERNTEGIISFLKEKTTHPWVDASATKQQQEEEEEKLKIKNDDL